MSKKFKVNIAKKRVVRESRKAFKTVKLGKVSEKLKELLAVGGIMTEGVGSNFTAKVPFHLRQEFSAYLAESGYKKKFAKILREAEDDEDEDDWVDPVDEDENGDTDDEIEDSLDDAVDESDDDEDKESTDESEDDEDNAIDEDENGDTDDEIEDSLDDVVDEDDSSDDDEKEITDEDAEGDTDGEIEDSLDDAVDESEDDEDDIEEVEVEDGDDPEEVDESEDDEDKESTDESEEDEDEEKLEENIKVLLRAVNLDESAVGEVRTILKAAVAAETSKIRINERKRFDRKLSKIKESNRKELASKLSVYTEAVVKSFEKKWAPVRESNTKTILAGKLVTEMFDVLKKNNIEVPKAKVNAFETVSKTLSELRKDYAKLLKTNESLAEKVQETEITRFAKEITKEMTDSQKSRFNKMISAFEFNSVREFKDKAKLIAESFFLPKEDKKIRLNIKEDMIANETVVTKKTDRPINSDVLAMFGKRK